MGLGPDLLWGSLIYGRGTKPWYGYLANPHYQDQDHIAAVTIGSSSIFSLNAFELLQHCYADQIPRFHGSDLKRIFYV